MSARARVSTSSASQNQPFANYITGLRSEFNTQMVSVLAKVNADIYQANSVALRASQEVQELRHSEKAQSGVRRVWQELHDELSQANRQLREK